jgi:hypothetical protein
MKKSLYIFPLAIAMAPAALLLASGCSKSGDTPTAADKVQADASNLAADAKATATDTWASVKDYTFEKRAEFSASFDRMTASLDDKTRDWKAKLAGTPDAASKDRDAAVKDYDDARANLKSKLTDLGNATSDTWADAKAKVDEAWKSVQAAYDRMTGATPPPQPAA